MKNQLLIVFLFICLLAPAPAFGCPDIDGLVDVNCDQKVQITAFGDSITSGRGDPSQIGYPGRLGLIFPHVVIVNLGVPGEDTYRGKSRAAREFAAFPDSDYTIVLQGLNDYWREERSASRTKSNVLSIIGSAQNQGAVSLLANLTAVKRSYQKSWVSSVNGQINPYRQIDFFSLGERIISSDLIHPDGQGYWDMAYVAAAILRTQSEINRPIDTDSDGIYDFAESRFGSNPLIADSDNDTLLDGAEVFVHGSNPTLLDSDGDGFSDPVEVNEMGSNPGDPRPTAPTLQTLEIIHPTE